jgi:uncharacterized membrane protein HdeD (DUF308 family)
MKVVAADDVWGGLVDNWWMFAVRGVLALIFGVLALLHPLAALMAIVFVFGVWALVDGVSALTLAFAGPRSWQLALVGVLGIATGAITFFWPGLTALGLYAAVAVWSIVRGVLEIALAVELRRIIRGELWLILGGLTSILFGALLIALPLAGVLALAWLVGVYAIAFGIIMCALALRLRRLKTPQTTPPITAPPVAT